MKEILSLFFLIKKENDNKQRIIIIEGLERNKMKTLKYYELLDKNNSMIPLSYDYLVKSIFDRNQRFLRLFLNSQLKQTLNIDFLNKNFKI